MSEEILKTIRALVVPSIGEILFLLTIAATLPSCSVFHGGKTRAVCIQVIAGSVPPGSRIFITGSGDALGNWSPGIVRLSHEPDGSWSKTINIDQGTEVYFKITRGNWNTEALDERDPQIGALQHFIVDGDTTMKLGFSRWMDRDAGLTRLKAKLFHGKDYYAVSNAWRYHGGDDFRWALPSYGDSAWDIVNSRLEAGNEPPSGWNRIGWFRLHLDIDSSLWNVPVAFNIRQGGASEIYLDGKKLYTFGSIGHSANDEKTSFPDQNPKIITFTPKAQHVLAVRYSNFSRAPMQRDSFFRGFQIALSNWPLTLSSVQTDDARQIVFTTILAVLVLIHLLLFIYNPKFRENLYYSISTLGGVGVWIANGGWTYSISERHIGMLDMVAQVSSIVAILFGLLLVYSFSEHRLPKRIWAYVSLGIGLAVWGGVQPGLLYFRIRDVFTVVMFLEMVWGIIRVPRREKIGGMILIVGFSVLAFTVIYGMLPGYGLLPPSFPLTRDPFIYGLMALGVAMSVFLSLRFARTNRELELKVVEVSQLSEQTLSQERQARDSEIERRLLAADNERKTKELEDARQLQLSMLPRNVPSIPNLDIAVRMETATEVGGDYYDFFSSDGDRLMAVIGDATGHGLKAGNMVIATKGLLNVLSNDGSLDQILKVSNRAIKRMNLHMLTMCLAMVRIKDSRLEFASAGMPPLLVYRKEKKDVEQIVQKAMPLGAFIDFPYGKMEAAISPGDVVLLVSDGLTELFSDRQEPFGTDRIVEALKESAEKSAGEIISYIFEKAEAWRGGSPLNDDLTMLAIKIRG